MTNQELIEKLNQAQSLLSDVYHWACKMQESKLMRNSEIASQMGCAEDCILEVLDILEGND